MKLLYTISLLCYHESYLTQGSQMISLIFPRVFGVCEVLPNVTFHANSLNLALSASIVAASTLACLFLLLTPRTYPLAQPLLYPCPSLPLLLPLPLPLPPLLSSGAFSLVPEPPSAPATSPAPVAVAVGSSNSFIAATSSEPASPSSTASDVRIRSSLGCPSVSECFRFVQPTSNK